MRVLCTCVPSQGRFRLVVPIAAALRDAGHDVLFLAPTTFRSDIEQFEFRTTAAGLDTDQVESLAKHAQGDFCRLPADRRAALMFTQMAPWHLQRDGLIIARDWDPQVVLHEEGEFAGPIIAFCRGIPNINVSWPSPVRSQPMLASLDAHLRRLWHVCGLEPTQHGGLYSNLTLDSCPPSLQQRHAGMLGPAIQMRPVLPRSRNPAASAPPVFQYERSQANIYATLGTVPMFNGDPGVFTLLIEALSLTPFNVLVTVGANNSITAFEGLLSDRRSLHVANYIDQSDVLPYADLVICHGGSGSTIGALIHGLPILFVPRGGAAQQRNASACARLGLSLNLDACNLSLEVVHESVLALLRNPTYRQASAKVAAEIGAMPTPTEVVASIERFVYSSERQKMSE